MKNMKINCPLCKISGSPQGIRRHLTVTHKVTAEADSELAARMELATMPREAIVTCLPGMPHGTYLTAVQSLAQTKLLLRSNELRTATKELKKKNLRAGRNDEVYLPGKQSWWIETADVRHARREQS